MKQIKSILTALVMMAIATPAHAEVRSQLSGDRDVIRIIKVGADRYRFQYCQFERSCRTLGFRNYTSREIQTLHAGKIENRNIKWAADGLLVVGATLGAGAIGFACLATAGTVCAAVVGAGSIYSGVASGIAILGGSAGIGAIAAGVATAKSNMNPQVDDAEAQATSAADMHDADIRISGSIQRTAVALDHDLKHLDL